MAAWPWFEFLSTNYRLAWHFPDEETVRSKPILKWTPNCCSLDPSWNEIILALLTKWFFRLKLKIILKTWNSLHHRLHTYINRSYEEGFLLRLLFLAPVLIVFSCSFCINAMFKWYLIMSRWNFIQSIVPD